jgi:hypothetical protein
MKKKQRENNSRSESYYHVNFLFKFSKVFGKIIAKDKLNNTGKKSKNHWF